MLSTALKRASRSDATRRFIEKVPVTQRVVDRFVAGDSIGDAIRTADELVRARRHVTIDVLGEDVTDAKGAARTTSTYLALLEELSREGHAEGVDLSLKLTALGQALPRVGDAVAEYNAHEICQAAAAVGCTVTLDMEDHTTVDSTLAIGSALRSHFGDVANVLQSNLLRTPGDIEALARTGARIRLVKGAYREPASVAHQRKADVDEAYRSDIDALMASTCYPMVATHDPAMLTHAGASAVLHGRGVTRGRCRCCYGVRTDLQSSTVEAGRRLRVYVPFGTDWYGYFMRRLAERPANVAFFLRALTHA